jgi:ATP-binding cassette, subfamily C, bacterial LapB
MNGEMDVPPLAPSGTGRGDVGTLEQCLLHVAELLGRPIGLAELHATAVGGAGEFGVREALDAAGANGLQAGFGQLELAELDSASLPAILLLSHGRAIVAEHQVDEDALAVFDPRLGPGLGRMGRSAVSEVYSGYAIIVRAAQRDGGHDEGKRRRHWFWSAMAQNRWSYVQVMLAAVVANFLGLATSIFIMVVYDRVLPNEAFESLIALTLGVCIALIFDFIIKSLRASFVDRAGQKADKEMGRQIFNQLLDLQLKARKGSTGAIANTMREFETLREFFTSATLVAVVDLPFIFLFIFVIYLIGGPLALVPAVAVPIVLLVGLAVQPLLAGLAERSFAAGQSKQTVLVETISGLETIKAAGAARQMRARWEDAIERHADHGVRSRAVSQFALNATAFVQQAAQVFIVFFGVFLIAAGTVSMGALIAAVILTGRTLAPLAQLAQTLTRLNAARTSYRSLDALMSSESERPYGRRWLSRPKLAGGIVFDNVSFKYPDAMTDTLSGVSFRISPGEKVAILGRIGCGKSTIARLILGLYEPISGAVLHDGTDIRQIHPEDVRRNVGTALQDVWLFSGTVRENIAIGSRKLQDEEVLRCARIAGADDFVSRHPSGYDLVLSERGEGLSGGQKQALALARALVGRPPILLFDEPTSSMDLQNEALVIDRLRSEVADRTLVVITHRTSLLDLVDRVIVIDQGKVVADGPKSLLARAQDAQVRAVS